MKKIKKKPKELWFENNNAQFVVDDNQIWDRKDVFLNGHELTALDCIKIQKWLDKAREYIIYQDKK